MKKYFCWIAPFLAFFFYETSSATCARFGPIPTVREPIMIRESIPEEQIYGIQTRFLIGNWQWSDFDALTTRQKTGFQAEALSEFAARCLTDRRYGRILSADTYSPQDQPLDISPYLDEVIKVKAELLALGVDFKDTAISYTPSLSEQRAERMFANLLAADQTLLDVTATETRYLFDLLETYTKELELMRKSLVTSRSLVSALIEQSPAIRDLLFSRLQNNTNQIMDTYGAFFSKDAKTLLKEKIESAKASSSIFEQIDAYNAWIATLESTIENTYENSEYLRSLSIKIQLIFGEDLRRYFPESPNAVDNILLVEGDE